MTRTTAALSLLAALALAASGAAQDGYADPTFSGDGWEVPTAGAWSATYP